MKKCKRTLQNREILDKVSLLAAVEDWNYLCIYVVQIIYSRAALKKSYGKYYVKFCKTCYPSTVKQGKGCSGTICFNLFLGGVYGEFAHTSVDSRQTQYYFSCIEAMIRTPSFKPFLDLNDPFFQNKLVKPMLFCQLWSILEPVLVTKL